MAEVVVVLEGKDMGVHILLVDLMTGKYGITMKHILYDDQGLDVKWVQGAADGYLLVVAERHHLGGLNSKDPQEDGKPDLDGKNEFQSKSSAKFETVITRHYIKPFKDLSNPKHQVHLTIPNLRVHQCMKVPNFHEILQPFFIVQIYTHLIPLNFVTMKLADRPLFVLPPFRKQFPRIDLNSAVFNPSLQHLYILHDD